MTNHGDLTGSDTLPRNMKIEIGSTSTRKDSKGKAHTVFHITIRGHDRQWEVMRRFSQFDRVHKQLMQKFTQQKSASVRLPELPPKRWLGSLGNDFVDKRRVLLQKYLRELLMVPEIAQSPQLHAFLKNSEYDTCKTPELHLPPSAVDRLSPCQLESNGESNGNSTLAAQFRDFAIQSSKRMNELERRCKVLEHTANTALRIAQLAASSLSIDARRKLERKVRTEMKALADRKAQSIRKLSADIVRERIKPEAYPGGDGFTNDGGFGRSRSWLTNLGGKWHAHDSDEDPRPQASSLDRRRMKRRNELLVQDQSNIWGPSKPPKSSSTTRRHSISFSRDSKDRTDTFERFLRFTTLTSKNGVKDPFNSDDHGFHHGEFGAKSRLSRGNDNIGGSAPNGSSILMKAASNRSSSISLTGLPSGYSKTPPATASLPDQAASEFVTGTRWGAIGRDSEPLTPSIDSDWPSASKEWDSSGQRKPVEKEKMNSSGVNLFKSKMQGFQGEFRFQSSLFQSHERVPAKKAPEAGVTGHNIENSKHSQNGELSKNRSSHGLKSWETAAEVLTTSTTLSQSSQIEKENKSLPKRVSSEPKQIIPSAWKVRGQGNQVSAKTNGAFPSIQPGAKTVGISGDEVPQSNMESKMPQDSKNVHKSNEQKQQEQLKRNQEQLTQPSNKQSIKPQHSRLANGDAEQKQRPAASVSVSVSKEKNQKIAKAQESPVTDDTLEKSHTSTTPLSNSDSFELTDRHNVIFKESAVSSGWNSEPVQRQVGNVLKHVLSCPQLNIRRKQALELITDIIRRTMGAQVYMHGSYALRTDLPESDVDISAFFSKGQTSTWVQRVVNALCQAANIGDAPRHLSVRSVTFVNAEVPIIKTIVGRIHVDISGNQVGALEALGLFEACDRIVGKDHLLKRTIILLKAWAKNEAHILGAKEGMLSSFCLRTIVLFIFNAFHERIQNPIQGLYQVFAYLEDFPWPELALGIYGPLCIRDLPGYTSSSNSESSWPQGKRPLFDPELIRQYSIFSRPHSQTHEPDMKHATLYHAAYRRTGPLSAERDSAASINSNLELTVDSPPNNIVENQPHPNLKNHAHDKQGKKHSKQNGTTNQEISQLISKLMTVVDPTNPFNNVAKSVTSYKHSRMIQKQFNSAARGMRMAAMQWETDHIKISHFVTSVLFLNTVNRYRGAWGRPRGRLVSCKSETPKTTNSDEFKNGSVTGSPKSLVTTQSDTDHYTETDLSCFSGGEQSEPYAADLKTIGDRLAHARQFEAPLITEEQLVALVVILLDQHGAVPIGKMGSMLHNATNNHSLPAMIKSKYGGLKRFLVSHSRLFRVGVDHPFNPPVHLLQKPTTRQRQLVQGILKSSGGSLTTGGSAKLPPKPAGMGNRRDRANSSASGRRNNRSTESPSSVSSVRSSVRGSPNVRGSGNRNRNRRQSAKSAAHQQNNANGPGNWGSHPMHQQQRLINKLGPPLMHLYNHGNALTGFQTPGTDKSDLQTFVGSPLSLSPLNITLPPSGDQSPILRLQKPPNGQDDPKTLRAFKSQAQHHTARPHQLNQHHNHRRRQKVGNSQKNEYQRKSSGETSKAMMNEKDFPPLGGR